MEDRSYGTRRHWIDRAAEFGQHTFVATRFGPEPDSNVWRCTGCGVTILGYELEDNLWQLKAGAQCPAFAVALTSMGYTNGPERNQGKPGERAHAADGVDRGSDGAAIFDQHEDQGGPRPSRRGRADAARRGWPEAFIFGIAAGVLIGMWYR